MTNRALGEALGISHAAVGKLKKRGMPSDSVDDAREWRRTRLNPNRRKNVPGEPVATTALNNSSPSQEQVEQVSNETELQTDRKACREALQEAREMRRYARAMVGRSNQEGDPESARRWTTLHQQLLARQAPLEVRYRDLLARDRVTILYSEAEATFRNILQDIRVLSSSMPDALAAKVNPADPLHAKRILEEWRDKTLFKRIYGNQKPAS